ncbi:hypothetical protein [Sphingomonas sp. OK281]|uniref:hypothetical protein n=1 Tax=Sphingomonas sp. OK281 TaxID=1881067 RepID=UPI000B847D05|nr:hypothetical protein [Sphingomonas sp. OK281]
MKRHALVEAWLVRGNRCILAAAGTGRGGARYRRHGPADICAALVPRERVRLDGGPARPATARIVADGRLAATMPLDGEDVVLMTIEPIEPGSARPFGQIEQMRRLS